MNPKETLSRLKRRISGFFSRESRSSEALTLDLPMTYCDWRDESVATNYEVDPGEYLIISGIPREIYSNEEEFFSLFGRVHPRVVFTLFEEGVVQGDGKTRIYIDNKMESYIDPSAYISLQPVDYDEESEKLLVRIDRVGI